MSAEHPGPYCTSTPESSRADWLDLAGICARSALRDHHTAMRLGYGKHAHRETGRVAPLSLAYRNGAWQALAKARAALAKAGALEETAA